MHRFLLFTCLLAAVFVLLTGCQRSDIPNDPQNQDTLSSTEELFGLSVCTPEEAATLTADRTVTENIPAFFSISQLDDTAETHPVPCADLERKPTFYLPLDPQTVSWDDLTLRAEGCSCYLVTNALTDKQTALAEGRRFRLLFLGTHYYAEAYLIFTGLPMLTIDLVHSDGTRAPQRVVDERDRTMRFSFYDGNDPQTGSIISAQCAGKVHMRGNTSSAYEKKSMKFSLYKDIDCADQKNLSMCGLRRDDDWVLNAMYQEETKVRDMLAYSLWEDIGADHYGDGTVCGTRMRYVELILGGKYWGLYGLCEPEDAKQFGINAENPGSLYKTGSWIIPSAAEISTAARNHDDRVADMELKYPSPDTEHAWEALRQYITYVYERSYKEYADYAAEHMDIDQLIELWIFVNVIGGSDNTGKNLYFVQRDSDETFVIAPWDCDISFGLAWEENTYLHLYHNHDVVYYIMNLRCTERLFSHNIDNTYGRVQEKWAELRADFLTTDEIISRARAYRALLTDTGALQRNKARWSRSGYVDNLDYLEDFVEKRMKFLDRYIENLQTE